MITFTIPGRLPGLNSIIASSRTNYHKANSEKRKAQSYVRLFLPKKRITKSCEIRMTCYEPSERRDVDNVIAGACKVILDEMVHCGILANDNRRWVKQIHSLVYTDKQNPRIEVEVIE